MTSLVIRVPVLCLVKAAQGQRPGLWLRWTKQNDSVLTGGEANEGEVTHWGPPVLPAYGTNKESDVGRSNRHRRVALRLCVTGGRQGVSYPGQ